ncbi:MAG: hypothetical protein VW032_02590, partial [Pontimonas sp.]
MVRPKPAPETPEPEAIPEPTEVPPPSEEPDEPDTLSKATGWLRRSLNLGKKADVVADQAPAEETAVAEEATQVMSLFDIEEAERVAEQKRRPQRAPVRFVLKFAHGANINVGDMPG